MVGQKGPSNLVFRAQEMTHRFGVKSDFARYSENKVSASPKLKNICLGQRYVPPNSMLNKNFLRHILTDKQRLLKLSKVKQIEVEKHEELSFVDLFGKFKNDEGLMSLCTDYLPKGCLPGCIQFSNILNTNNLRIQTSSTSLKKDGNASTRTFTM